MHRNIVTPPAMISYFITTGVKLPSGPRMILLLLARFAARVSAQFHAALAASEARHFFASSLMLIATATIFTITMHSRQPPSSGTPPIGIADIDFRRIIGARDGQAESPHLQSGTPATRSAP